MVEGGVEIACEDSDRAVGGGSLLAVEALSPGFGGLVAVGSRGVDRFDEDAVLGQLRDGLPETPGVVALARVAQREAGEDAGAARARCGIADAIGEMPGQSCRELRCEFLYRNDIRVLGQPREAVHIGPAQTHVHRHDAQLWAVRAVEGIAVGEPAWGDADRERGGGQGGDDGRIALPQNNGQNQRQNRKCRDIRGEGDQLHHGEPRIEAGDPDQRPDRHWYNGCPRQDRLPPHRIEPSRANPAGMWPSGGDRAMISCG
ncbi:hypothetical protein DFR76_109244 [Nocardia pseudobrasiliensis]|uniref:Uncharacterized protein n=1 Tax=Nocardia pseudobrasiliensis TaxID=45979 RepID=A0A370I3L3_9NOCA|nr:hypothetical protein DFR76_109244 [Nocardia pseudobrasiliensis]